MRRRGKRLQALGCFVCLSELAAAQWNAYQAVPRWGQASLLINSPPTLLISGGKTASGYSFASAPNTPDLLALDLSSSFSTANASWTSSSNDSSGPSVSFHSLSSLGSSSYLLFGGDATGLRLPSANDSSWLLNASPSSSAAWTDESAGWAHEPLRRDYHTATAAGSGTTYIFGGLRNDGSGIAFNELWEVTGSGSSANWAQVAATGDTAPAIYAHTATWLSGQLVVVGGIAVGYGSASLASLSNVWVFSPSSGGGSWAQTSVSGTAPSNRRGHVAVALDSSRILVHGGANLDGSTCYDDAAILTLSGSSASWSPVTASSGAPSARYAHSAALANNQLVVAFGYGASGPADAGVYVFDPTSSSWLSTFSASGSPSPSSTQSSTTSSQISTTAMQTSTTQTTSQSSSTNAPSSSKSAAATAAADVQTPASSDTGSSQKTYIIAGSVGGAVALLAVGIGAAVYAKRRSGGSHRRRRTFGRPRTSDDGVVEKANARQPWRRFDLEDEEAVWTGRTPEQRDNDFYDTEYRAPSRGGFVDAPLVASYRPVDEASLFDTPESTPKRQRTRKAPVTPRTYRNAEPEEREPVMREVSSPPPASLMGSTFSPVPPTPDLYDPLRRSGTWWNRFSANAGLMRSTSTLPEPSIRDPTPRPSALEAIEEADGASTVHEREMEEDDRPTELRSLIQPTSPLRDSVSLASMSSSVLEERVRGLDVSQSGPRPSETSEEEDDDPFADAPTPRIGGATPGSIVWRGDQVFSPVPPVPDTPAQFRSSALGQSARSNGSGVRKLVAAYEQQVIEETASASSSPVPSPKKGAHLVKKPKLFVTNV